MLAVSYYFVNCVIISCKLSFTGRFTHNKITIMPFLDLQKAELGRQKAELGCQKAALGCHNTKANILSNLTQEGAPILFLPCKKQSLQTVLWMISLRRNPPMYNLRTLRPIPPS